MNAFLCNLVLWKDASTGQGFSPCSQEQGSYIALPLRAYLNMNASLGNSLLWKDRSGQWSCLKDICSHRSGLDWSHMFSGANFFPKLPLKALLGTDAFLCKALGLLRVTCAQEQDPLFNAPSQGFVWHGWISLQGCRLLPQGHMCSGARLIAQDSFSRLCLA